MTTFAASPTPGMVGSPTRILAHVPHAATRAHRPVGWRRLALLGGLLAVPAAAGAGVARAMTPRRGLLAGGLAALALGTLRVELARWFTPEPAYEREGRLGALELRRYAARIEASAEIDVSSLEQALDRGYSRLAGYVCGTNRTGELLQRAAPVLTAVRDGRYTVSFVMPPGRVLGSLPRPTHPGVELREVPGCRIAALRFRGRFTRDNIAAHERALLEQLLDAGLAARGSIMFAAFDWPVTLPILRRNELWIEIV